MQTGIELCAWGRAICQVDLQFAKLSNLKRSTFFVKLKYLTFKNSTIKVSIEEDKPSKLKG